MRRIKEPKSDTFLMGLFKLFATLFLFWALLSLLLIVGDAQTLDQNQLSQETSIEVLCIRRSDTILRDRPQFVALGIPYGYPVSVQGVPYLQSIVNFGYPLAAAERSSIAIQYAVQQAGPRSIGALRTPLRAYLGVDLPTDVYVAVSEVSLGDALNRYLRPVSYSERIYWGTWLAYIVGSSINNSCNGQIGR